MARISMRSNRKFMRLCRDIQRPPYQVRGLLEMMWESAHENEPTFPTLDDAEVVSTWDGEAGVFGKALLACGFLDAVEGGFFVHDYWQHAPGWVREREKKRRQRDASGTDRGRTGDKVGTELGQDGDVSSHGAPSVAKPSVAKPSEEDAAAAGQPRIKKPTDPLLGEKKKWAVDEWNKVAEDRGWSRVSKIPEGATGELLDARVRDDWWIENYPAALRIVWNLQWPDKPKKGKKGLRFVAMLRGDAVRAIVDGEWNDPKEEFQEGGSRDLTVDEAEALLAEVLK